MIRMLLGVFLFVALPLTLAGAIGYMMVTDPGVFLMSWSKYRVDSTFWGGMLFILLLFFGPMLVIFLTRLLYRYFTRRSPRSARKETLTAINSWLDGKEDRALASLSRLTKAGGSEQLSRAVSLAIGMSHSDWPDRYSDLKAKESGLKRFADSLKAEWLWQHEKIDEFVDWMRIHPELNKTVWLRERYWDSLLTRNEGAELIQQLKESGSVIAPEARQQWLVKAIKSALTQVGQTGDDGLHILKQLPKAQRNLPDITGMEIQFLIQAGKHDAAFKRMKTLLSEGHIDKSDLLLDIKVDNSQKLNYLESLQPSQPKSGFCLTLGLLNLRQQLWGNAQNWLEKGWAQGDRRCGLHLAELFEERNMTEQANRLYRQLATGQLTKVN